MAIRDLLPRTRQRFLLAAILFLVAGLVLEALLEMWNYLAGGSWGSLALAVFGIALATGLWRLHPAAR